MPLPLRVNPFLRFRASTRRSGFSREWCVRNVVISTHRHSGRSSVCHIKINTTHVRAIRNPVKLRRYARNGINVISIAENGDLMCPAALDCSHGVEPRRLSRCACGPRSALRRAVFRGGVFHWHLLSAGVPVTVARQAELRFLPHTGRGGTRRLSAVPALPARTRARHGHSRCRGHTCRARRGVHQGRRPGSSQRR